MQAHFSELFTRTINMCTIVTLISTLTEILILKEVTMKKVIREINRLISKQEAKTISKAAQLLCKDDKYDNLFFQACRATAEKQVHPHIVELGTKYLLVEQVTQVTKNNFSIMEVGPGDD